MKTKYQQNIRNGMWRSKNDPTLPIETSICRIQIGETVSVGIYNMLYLLGWIGDEFKRLVENGTINSEDYCIEIGIRRKSKTP